MTNEKQFVTLSEIEKAFEPVIGYNSIKKEMITICDIMRNTEYYVKLGVSVPSGLLLSGEPGLGKTLMANCFIKASLMLLALIFLYTSFDFFFCFVFHCMYLLIILLLLMLVVLAMKLILLEVQVI